MRHVSRRKFLSHGAALTLGSLAVAHPVCGQQNRSGATRSGSKGITPVTQRAIDRGLAHLAKRQFARGRNKGAFGTAGYSGGVAVCGLGGLAFMCGGSPPGEGPYGEHVDRCIDFIVRCMRPDGYISAPRGQDQMYGHGFATLFLAQAYGMSHRRDVGQKLRKAVKLIIATQNDAGGWRYSPRKSDADLSITICQVMALRAAADAGVDVPEATRKRCIEYVKKSQNSDGGFRYQVSGGGSTFPLTGAGLVSLYSAGIYEGEAVDKGLAWLMKHVPSGSSTGGSYYFYGQYYAVQATWHAGGEHWDRWYPAIRSVLLAAQRSDGSWFDSTVGAEFGTAMGCIILQMPNDFVPIFSQ